MIKVEAHLVDGGLFELQHEGDAFLTNLRGLQAQGYEGKRLIDALITDDWSPAPKYVDITGNDANGEPVDVRIPYR